MTSEPTLPEQKRFSTLRSKRLCRCPDAPVALLPGYLLQAGGNLLTLSNVFFPPAFSMFGLFETKRESTSGEAKPAYFPPCL